jgi:hypothetical protein
MNQPLATSAPVLRLIEIANGTGKDAKNAREHLDGMGIAWKRSVTVRKPLPAPVPSEPAEVKALAPSRDETHVKAPLLALQWLFVLVCGLLVMRFAAWSVVTISHLWERMSP